MKKKTTGLLALLALIPLLIAAGAGISTWTAQTEAITDTDFFGITDVSDTTGSTDGTSKKATGAQVKAYVSNSPTITGTTSFPGSSSVDGSGDATFNSVSVPASATPGWAFEDSSAAVGVAIISSGSTGAYDTKLQLRVDDTETGDDTVYIDIDGDGNSISLNAKTIVDGTVQGRIVFNSYTAAQTITVATNGGGTVQMTTADEVTFWDCETANIGDFVGLWARDAEKIECVPASGDHFVLFDGTALDAGDELDMAATAGTKVSFLCTADDTWSVYTETAASTDGGVAD